MSWVCGHPGLYLTNPSSSITVVTCVQPICKKIAITNGRLQAIFRPKFGQLKNFHQEVIWISNFSKIIVNILFWDHSTGAIWLMLRFKVADLQLFSDWLIYICHYFICKELEFKLFKICYLHSVSYASTGAIWFMLQFKMRELQLVSDWLIYICHYFTCKEWEYLFVASR